MQDRRSGSRGKSEDLIPEHLYRKYTETDSRPLSPDLTRRSVSVPRVKGQRNGIIAAAGEKVNAFVKLFNVFLIHKVCRC